MDRSFLQTKLFLQKCFKEQNFLFGKVQKLFLKYYSFLVSFYDFFRDFIWQTHIFTLTEKSTYVANIVARKTYFFWFNTGQITRQQLAQ